MNPIARLFIHLVLAFSFLLASNSIAKENKYKFLLIEYALIGFVLTNLLGITLWVLYYLHVVSLKFYSLFNVLTQFGYGVLRLSPGSYPNEYGTLASYFSCVLLIYLFSKEYNYFKYSFMKNKFILIFLFVFSIVGMLLATTRSAYITFAISIIIIFSFFNKKYFLKFSLVVVVCLLIVYLFSPNIILSAVKILKIGYFAAVNGTGSISDRYVSWSSGWNLFKDCPFIGVGFENQKISMLHNTYLQFLFGLGIILFTLVFLIYQLLFSLISRKMACVMNNYSEYVYVLISIVGIIHVAIFATNNHNQNHFLTWLVIFIFITSCKSKYKTVFYKKWIKSSNYS